MAEVCLGDWDHHDRNWRLDTDSGLIAAAAGQRRNGWVSRSVSVGGEVSGPDFVAVYALEGELWFQAPSGRWPVGSASFHRTCDDKLVHCQFTVIRGGDILFSLDYIGPLGDPLNQRDLSFDALDEELLDIFLFLARNGNDADWRRDKMASWSEV